MCLIIDNNLRDRIFFRSDDPDFTELGACLFGNTRPTARIVYGGQLRREYLSRPEMLKRLAELDKAGRARIVSDDAVDEEEAVIRQGTICQSNDYHVLALARVARVRLLCTLDQKLIIDFRNKDVIDRPRGKVYNRRSHNALMQEFCRSTVASTRRRS